MAGGVRSAQQHVWYQPEHGHHNGSEAINNTPPSAHMLRAAAKLQALLAGLGKSKTGSSRTEAPAPERQQRTDDGHHRGATRLVDQRVALGEPSEEFGDACSESKVQAGCVGAKGGWRRRQAATATVWLAVQPAAPPNAACDR